MKKTQRQVQDISLIILGLLLIAFSAAYLVHRHRWVGTRTWVPLDMPVVLKVGQIRSQEFVVNIPDHFEVLLQTDRKIPKDEQEKLLGVNFLPVRENRVPHGIRLRWTSTDEFGNIQRGETNSLRSGAFSKDHISLLLGMINVDKPGRYQLQLQVLDDGGRLSECNPRLKVKLDGTRGLNYGLGGLFDTLLFSLTALLGAGLVTVSWISYRHAHRRPDATEIIVA